MTSGSAGFEVVGELDTAVPHSARIWNYWLGGKDNFAPDREVGDEIIAACPEIIEVARESRVFLGRAVQFLAGEAGVRQFLDIGAGLPAFDNTHEVAQRIAPESRIVYVDNDPMVLAHARALFTSGPVGVTACIDADARDPDKILRDAAGTLDFTRPIAAMMLGILGNVADGDAPGQIVRRFVAGLPAGSYVVINDGVMTPAISRAVQVALEAGAGYHLRTPEQIEGFFDGLDLVAPGVISTPLWRPSKDAEPKKLSVYCGVARKADPWSRRGGAPPG